MRFLMIVKATEDSEAGIHGKPEQYAAMGELMEDMAKARAPSRSTGIR